MAAATLCQLCQSIPLHDLPRFPDSSYTRTLSGQKHLHDIIHLKSNDPIPDPLGFHHHPDLESLRRASAAGCDLCRQIEIQADGVLADIAERDAKWARFPKVRTLPGDPSFDLWVTRRGEGGDGFWVSSKSASEPQRILFPIATFGFCAEDDSPLASTFPGRPIVGPPTNNALDRVANWVTACDSHKNCTGGDPSLPTRLLDVGGPGPESIVTVVETEEGTKGAYTALSYCWGTASNPYTTTRSLYDARKDGMNLADLPQTFRDAIAMTRRLGVRYIWIDSLCICQDDAKDWERESARMAAVYSNAYLTIAATGAPDASAGLLFDRPAKAHLCTPLKQTGSGNSAVEGDMLIFHLEKAKEIIRKHRVDLREEPLARRGWAFQERLLARRVLHFASDQISFECLEGTVFEDGLRMPHRYFHAHPDQGLDKESHLAKRRREEETPKRGRDWGAHIDRWHSLLAIYSDRKLTFPEDKLPALSGVAKVYSDLLDDEYVAGIWRKSMIEGLSWQSLDCTAIDIYRAPSWSWASVEGTAATGFFGSHREVASILDHHVKIDGDNPFGRVKDAWLKIKAPLIPLALSERTGPTGHMCLKPENSDTEGEICGFDTIDRSYSASAEMIRGMKLYGLVLASLFEDANGRRQGGEVAGEVSNYMCLVVTPAGKGRGEDSMPGALKRVGCIFYSPHDFGAEELDSSIVTVTLV